jgi:hypothetical protein
MDPHNKQEEKTQAQGEHPEQIVDSPETTQHQAQNPVDKTPTLSSVERVHDIVFEILKKHVI